MDVIIEGAEAIPVLLQQSVCITVAKVLKLDEALVVVLAHDGVHELVNQSIVGGAVDALSVQANVVGIAQKIYPPKEGLTLTS